MARNSFLRDDMALAIAIWMCTLPLVGLFALPITGWQVSLLSAVGLLLIALVICRGICAWKIFH